MGEGAAPESLKRCVLARIGDLIQRGGKPHLDTALQAAQGLVLDFSLDVRDFPLILLWLKKEFIRKRVCEELDPMYLADHIQPEDEWWECCARTL